MYKSFLFCVSPSHGDRPSPAGLASWPDVLRAVTSKRINNSSQLLPFFHHLPNTLTLNFNTPGIQPHIRHFTLKAAQRKPDQQHRQHRQCGPGSQSP